MQKLVYLKTKKIGEGNVSEKYVFYKMYVVAVLCTCNTLFVFEYHSCIFFLS